MLITASVIKVPLLTVMVPVEVTSVSAATVSVPLRLSSIAAVGMLGDQSDEAFLNQLSDGESGKYVQEAARSAVEEIRSRARMQATGKAL